jgi:hypothetical protein
LGSASPTGRRTIRGGLGLGAKRRKMLDESRISSLFLSNKFEFLSKTILIRNKNIRAFSVHHRHLVHHRVSASKKTEPGSQ